MRETVKLFERTLNIDDTEQLDKPHTFFKKATYPDVILKNVGEGESIIDEESDNKRLLTKIDGVYYKPVVDGTDITLKEV